MLRGGDLSMLKVWVGLEARSFLQASVESVSDRLLNAADRRAEQTLQVERCVKYDLLSPNI